MTFRRTIVILILLAIAFFVYRAINPSGADAILSYLHRVPVRLWLSMGDVDVDLSEEVSLPEPSLPGLDLAFVPDISWLDFALEALVIPEQNITTMEDVVDEPFVLLATWWSLVIVDVATGNVPEDTPPSNPILPASTGLSLPKTTSLPSPSRGIADQASSQDISLLNNLFQ